MQQWRLIGACGDGREAGAGCNREIVEELAKRYSEGMALRPEGLREGPISPQ